MTALLVLIGAELAVTILASVWFMVAFASLGSPASRHLMAVSAVVAGEALALLLVMLRVPVPLWVFAVAYGAGAAVVVHRLVLLYRARRTPTPRA